MNLKNVKGRKHLERAIVLGLVLSTGVCGSAWAAIDGKLNLYVGAQMDGNYNDYSINGTSNKYTHDFGIKLESNKVQSPEGIGKGTLTFKNLTINIMHPNNLYASPGQNWMDWYKPPTDTNSGTNNYLAGIMTDSTYNKNYQGEGLQLDIDANSVNVVTESQNDFAVVGVWAQYNDVIDIDANENVIVSSSKTSGKNLSFYENSEVPEDRKLEAVYGLNASFDSRYSEQYSNQLGENTNQHRGGTIDIETKNGGIIVSASNTSEELTGSNIYAARSDNGVLNLVAKGNGFGIINLMAADNGNNNVHGIDAWVANEINLKADHNILVTATSNNGNAYGVSLDSDQYNESHGSRNNKFESLNNKIEGYTYNGEAYGLNLKGASTIDINALENGKNTGNNEFATYTYVSNVKVAGTGVAIYADEWSQVDVDAANKNTVYGAVYSDTSVIDLNAKNNEITSRYLIKKAEESGAKNNVVSAVYATNSLTEREANATVNTKVDAVVNITAAADGSNTIQSIAKEGDTERTVWAQDGAEVKIKGLTFISTNHYDGLHNSNNIAIVAGNENHKNRTTTDVDTVVTVEYDNYTNKDGSVVQSAINGDVLAAKNGCVHIYSSDSNDSINVTGNVLAANGGFVNLDLGKGGLLTGRIDDYADAGISSGHGAGESATNSFFNPAFSSAITESGAVNLTMGKGSRWNVTGQSWVSNIITDGSAEDTVIDLTKMSTANTNSSALTVGSFDGNTTFRMNITGNRLLTDMLYFGAANGDYVIELINPVNPDDIYFDSVNNRDFDGLRFATVGSGNASFTVEYEDTLLNKIAYKVDTKQYTKNDAEDPFYNSTDATGAADMHRPGSDSVDSLINSDNNSGIMTFTENDPSSTASHFRIVDSRASLSDVGQTILNMSRANYSNAIYMDRLNKRLGEARYINSEEDEGMWVRIRHDRIGKKDAYRSQNTMYELGYDQKQECDNGERRVGFAVDYMHGDTGYSDIAGKGEIDRYGLWLYDTWTGDKGHYADYVAKWGHLSNEFEVYSKMGNKVTGDYSNNVFSISAEYGRKKDIGSDWYFEPQAQLQLARVTGADYVTDQGTKVSVDGINSLIGRAGFRLGKDFGPEKQSTVYVKADVLHEFLGDQDISAMDDSTTGWQKISYENEGTWYDFGFGFATMMSKSSYAFLDLERSFGHDNDETWQINAGVQWSF